MNETRVAGRPLRGAPLPPAGRGLPDARLAERGRRRRAGGLAAAQPRRRRARSTNLGGWLTTVVARVCLNMLRSRKARREEPLDVHRARPVVEPRRRRRPRARGAAGRLGRAGAAGGARHARPGRAAGVRAARHVRRAVRRDRADRRPHAGRGPAARQPRPPPRAQGGAGARTRPGPAARRSSTRSSPPRARATSRRCSRCSTRTSCCAPTAAPPGEPRVVRGAAAVAGAGDHVPRWRLACARRWSTAPPGPSSPRRRPAGLAGRPSPSAAAGSSRSTSSPTPTGWPGSTRCRRSG